MQNRYDNDQTIADIEFTMAWHEQPVNMKLSRYGRDPFSKAIPVENTNEEKGQNVKAIARIDKAIRII